MKIAQEVPAGNVIMDGKGPMGKGGRACSRPGAGDLALSGPKAA